MSQIKTRPELEYGLAIKRAVRAAKHLMPVSGKQITRLNRARQLYVLRMRRKLVRTYTVEERDVWRAKDGAPALEAVYQVRPRRR